MAIAIMTDGAAGVKPCTMTYAGPDLQSMLQDRAVTPSPGSKSICGRVVTWRCRLSIAPALSSIKLPNNRVRRRALPAGAGRARRRVLHPSGPAAHRRYQSFDAVACTPNRVCEHRARPLAADLECGVGNSFGAVEAANDKGQRIDPAKRLLAGMALPKLKMEVGNPHAIAGRSDNTEDVATRYLLALLDVGPV